MRRMPSWTQKIEARNFPADSCTRNFLGRGGGSRYAAIPLVVALSAGHNDITRFRPWSPMATENHLDCAEKFQIYSDDWHRWPFFICAQVFRDPPHRELPHVQIFMNDGPNLFTWDAQLLSYWFSRNAASSNISSWIWSIISEVVTVLGRPGRGAS